MKKYWKSIEEYKGAAPADGEQVEMEHRNDVPGLLENDFLKKSSSRRDFLKVFGFSISFKQSSQTVISGKIKAEISPLASLCLISKEENPERSRNEYSKLIIFACEGFSVSIFIINSLRLSSELSASIVTPEFELITYPFKCNCLARR